MRTGAQIVHAHVAKNIEAEEQQQLSYGHTEAEQRYRQAERESKAAYKVAPEVEQDLHQASGRKDGRWVRTERSSARMVGNVRLDHVGVDRQNRAMLRQRFQALVGSRTIWLAAERFADGRSELHRQRGFKADQRHLRFAVRKPDLDAVGSVRVDDDTVPLCDATDGRDPVGVSASARSKVRSAELPGERGAGNVEAAFSVKLLPQLAHCIRIAPCKVEHEALEVRRPRYV